MSARLVATSTEVAEYLAAHNARREKIGRLDLRPMSRVLDLAPEDMTVTVETGIALAALQVQLAQHGQGLPIDPPRAESTTIGEVLRTNLSGPRRFGYGTVREHLIGMKVALADGRLIKSGGKVVKNVAGYDLAKLFIGAQDSLGIIVEATFKLRPRPSCEQFVTITLPSLAEVQDVVRGVLDAPVAPVVVDLHRAAGATEISAVLGFEGTREEVNCQLGVVRGLGFANPATLEYEAAFWGDAAPVHRASVLPSRLTKMLATLGGRPWVARAGNGIVYYRGEALPAKNDLPIELMRRIKAAYDPNNILPEIPW